MGKKAPRPIQTKKIALLHLFLNLRKLPMVVFFCKYQNFRLFFWFKVFWLFFERSENCRSEGETKLEIGKKKKKKMRTKKKDYRPHVYSFILLSYILFYFGVIYTLLFLASYIYSFILASCILFFWCHLYTLLFWRHIYIFFFFCVMF